DARQFWIDQFATVFEDVLKVKFWAVVVKHGSGKAAPRHCGRAAGGAALGCLDNGDTSFRTLECRHGAGGAATNDQYIRLVVHHRNIEGARVDRHGQLKLLECCGITPCAISTNASTQASAKAASLMCSASSSTRADSRCDLSASTKIR